MYIENPTKEQLDSWYCTQNIWLVDFFIKHIPVIHIAGKKYYFVKTKEFSNLIERLPRKLKLLYILKI